MNIPSVLNSRIKDKTITALFLFCISSLVLLTSGCTKKEEKPVDLRPNIILLSVDSLRFDMVGAYGNPYIMTPNCDKLSRRSNLFTRVYSPAPYTVPALASLMSGLLPQQHNARNILKKVKSENQIQDIPLSPEIDTWAESFKKKGYGTFAVTGGFTTKKAFSGLEQGFQVYDDDFQGVFRSAADVTAKARENILKNKNNPFFCWLHYYDSHFPYHGKTAYNTYYSTLQIKVHVPEKGDVLSQVVQKEIGDSVTEASIKNIVVHYLSSISTVDAQIGAFLMSVSKNLRTKRNQIILTADHGEGLGEHGEFFTHGAQLFDTTTRVPLLIHIPRGKNTHNAIYPQLVRTVDIMPTIDDLLGSAHKESILAGISLKNLLKGKEDKVELVGYSETKVVNKKDGEERLRAIITNEDKLIASSADGKNISTVYNLNDDPSELEPVKLQSDELTSLRKKLMEFTALQKVVKAEESKAVVQDEETKNKLKSLGYLGD